MPIARCHIHVSVMIINIASFGSWRNELPDSRASLAASPLFRIIDYLSSIGLFNGPVAYMPGISDDRRWSSYQGWCLGRFRYAFKLHFIDIIQKSSILKAPSLIGMLIIMPGNGIGSISMRNLFRGAFRHRHFEKYSRHNLLLSRAAFQLSA